MTATLDRPTTTDAAASERGSAYPPAIADVMPRARRIAAELGQRPSRRRLMRDLRIGGPKADAVLAQLENVPSTDATDTSTTDTSATDTSTTDTSTDGATPEVDPAPADVAAGAAALDDRTRYLASSPRHWRRSVLLPRDPDPDRPWADRADTTDTAPETASETVAADRDEPAHGPAPSRPSRRVQSWPVWLLALPAFVAIWSGWVGLGELTGFGVVHPLPGVWDSLSLNTAITLPIGMEAYAAFALRVWLSGSTPTRARAFARRSAVGALVLGAAGQVAYHLMSAAGVTAAPWWITAVVACLPVAVLGMGAALAHLLTDHETTDREDDDVNRERGEAQR